MQVATVEFSYIRGDCLVIFKYILILYCMCKWTVLHLFLNTVVLSCVGLGNLLMSEFCS